MPRNWAERKYRTLKHVLIWVFSIAVEIVCLLRHAVSAFIGCKLTTPGNNEVPIVLVHGYLGYKTFWNTFRRYLTREGLGPLYVIQLRKDQTHLKEHAQQLARLLEHVLVHHKERTIKLIGASRGGCVAAYFTEYMAKDLNINVTHVVTLASPLEGTVMANLLLSRRAVKEDLGYRSKNAMALREKIMQNDHTKYFHIISRTDLLVIPHTAGITGRNPSREWVLNGHSHNSILFSKKVAHKVAKWLQH